MGAIGFEVHQVIEDITSGRAQAEGQRSQRRGHEVLSGRKPGRQQQRHHDQPVLGPLVGRITLTIASRRDRRRGRSDALSSLTSSSAGAIPGWSMKSAARIHRPMTFRYPALDTAASEAT